MMSRSRSIVEFQGGRSGYPCGYCGSFSSKTSSGMWAHTMTVQDYQDLIDRGWRRSGKYVYKPLMDKTCCPQYTIKCDATNFKLNKSHKKVLKRVNKFLNTGEKPGSSKTEMDDVDGCVGGAVCDIPTEKMDEKFAAVIPESIDYRNILETSSEAKTSEEQKTKSVTSDKQDVFMGQSKIPAVTSTDGSKKITKTGTGADPSRPPCKKAKVLRREKWAQKQALKQTAPEGQANNKKKENDSKSLEDFLLEVSDNAAHKLEVVLVRSNPKSEAFERSFKESYKVFKKYQMEIHKEDESDCGQGSFVNFLVNSPLEEEFREGGFQQGYGSFHQQYWLDGRLISVGVLDILPNCVSSVYLYYDPEFFFLSPGTYSALRELEFVRKVHQFEPSIIYYYMGYYIHSCPKMKYKGQYVPSFLSCPETYTWHPIEECRDKLDANKYSRFAAPGVEEQNKRLDVNKTLVMYERQAMPYAIYKALNSGADEEDEVKCYAALAGRASERMLLYRE